MKRYLVPNLVRHNGAFPYALHAEGKSFPLLALCLLAMAGNASAASQTWSSTGASANWSSATNWGGNTAPGSTSSTSSDIATFNSAVGTVGVTGNPILIDQTTQNIGGISFGASAGAFFIGTTGGNSLFLGSTGSIANLTTTAAVETINAPLVLAGANNSYSLSSNSTTAADFMVFGGAISGNTAGSDTLTLTGTNVASSISSVANTNSNYVAGNITNGSATTFSVVKTGTGQWTLAGTNTFNGGVSVQQGELSLTGNVAAAGTGTITLGSSGNINASLYDGVGGTITNAINIVSGDTGTVILGNNSGNLDNFSGAITFLAGGGTTLTIAGSANSGFTVSGPISGTGNVVLSSGGPTNVNANPITISTGTLNNTGTVVNNGSGNQVSTINSNIGTAVTAIQENSGNSQLAINGNIASGSTATITSTLGTLTLSGTNQSTGIMSVASGATLSFQNPNSIFNANTGSWTSGNISVVSGATLAVGVGSNTSAAFTGSQISILEGLVPSGGFFGLDTSSVNGATGGYYNYSTAITPFGTGVGLAKVGAGELVLSGANTFTTQTWVQNGILDVTTLNNVGTGTLTAQANSNLGAPSSAANGTIILGNTTVTGVLLDTGTGETTDRSISLGGTTGNGTIDDSGTGTLTFTSGGTVTSTVAGSKTLTLQGNGTGVFDEAISNGSATIGLTKTGIGTWTLANSTSTGLDTNTGTTAVTGGVLALNFANVTGATPTNLLSSSSALTLGGGTLQVIGSATASSATSQTFSGLTLSGNTANAITLTPEGSTTSTTLHLGGIARGAGSSLNIDLSGAGGGGGTITLDSSVAAGTLGYATVTTGSGVYGFASANGTAITMLSPGTALNTTNASNASGTDYITSGAVAMTSATAFSVNTLTLNASSGTGSLNLDGSTMTISQKGLLSYGSNGYTISNGQIGATNSEVIFNTEGTGGLTIASGANIGSGTTALTKNGTDTLTIAGTQTYTGATIVNQGTLNITGSLTGVAGSNPGIDVNGTGTLTLSSVGALNAGATQLNVNNNGVVNVNSSGNVITFGTILNNNGTLNVNSGDSLSTNALTVNGGLLLVNGGTFTDTGGASGGSTTGAPATITIENGGTLTSGSDFSVGNSTASQMVINLGNGTGSGSLTDNSARLFIGHAGGATATLNQTAGTTLTVNELLIGGNSSSSATYNMTGGTLDLNPTGATIDSGGVWNINGGTIVPTGTPTLINTANDNASLAAAQINILGNGANFNIANGRTLTISAPLSHGSAGPATDGGLTMLTGTGTLILSGTNTYNGPVAVNAGVLNIASNGALGSSSGVTVASGAALDVSGVISTTNATPLSLIGTGISSTGALLNVSGNNTYSGLVTLASDATIGSTTGTLTLSNTGTITGGNLTFVGAGSTTVASALGSGIGNVTQSGSGTLTLSGNDAYTGATTVSAGTAIFKGANALPSASAISLGAATLTIDNDGAGSNGTISVGNSITISGSVTSTINVANNGSAHTGNTVAFGALNNGTGSQTNSSTINFTGANSYLQSYTSLGLTGLMGGNTTLNPTSTSVTILGNVINQESGTLSTHFDTLTLSGTTSGNIIDGTISDASTFVNFAGGGYTNVTVSGTGTWTLAGANTYSGATTVSAGALDISGSGTFGNTNAFILSGGLVDLGGTTQTIQGGLSITGAPATGNALQNGSLVASSYAASNASGNAIVTANLLVDGTAGLTKSGSGTLTLAGANTYTGSTAVSAGTLSLTGSLSASSVATSGTGNFSETTAGTISGSGITFAQGSTGTSTLAGSNSYTGTTTVSAGTLAINSVGALGSGAFLISGGTVANTSGSAINTAQTNNPAVTFGGTFGLGLAADTGGNGSLNVGSGAVTDANLSTNITLNSTAGGDNFTFGVVTNSYNPASGSGGQFLNVSGAGNTLTLGGYNLQSNGTAGTLSISTGTNQSANVTITGAVVNGDATANGITYGGPSDTGTLTLSGPNTYTGATVIAGGTVSVATINNLGTNGLTPMASSSLGAPTTVANATIAIGSTTTGGTLLYTGSGETTDRVISLAGTTGGATLNDSGTGTLNFLSNIAATGAGSKTLTLTGSTAGLGEVTGTIVDNSTTNTTAVAKSGTGAWLLNGVNTYTGGTTINAGTLEFNQATNLGNTSTGTITFGGGTLDLVASATALPVTLAHAITVGSGGGTIQVVSVGQTLTESGNITDGANTLTITGAGNTTISGVIGSGSTPTGGLTMNGTGILTLSNSNLYTGTTNINGGTVKISALNGLGATGNALGFNNGGILDSTANSYSISSPITLNGAGTIQDDSGTLTETGTVALGTNVLTVQGVGSTTLSGVISSSSNTGGITKAGTGTLTVNGSAVNTYTGPTTANNGTLVEDFANMSTATNLINSGSKLVLGGGTFQVKQKSGAVTAQTFGGVTVNNGNSSIIATNVSGSGTNTLTLTLGTVSLGSGSTGTLNFTLPTAGDGVIAVSNSTGPIGDWATVGSGTSLAYATVASGDIAALTGTTAATFAAVTSTAGTVNYALTADTGTSGAGAYANTIQSSTGAGANSVINAGGLQVNGLLNSGSGTWTISGGNLQIGGNNELVINANTAATTISANIVNDGSTASGVSYGGSSPGTLTLSGTNSYSGPTTINGGTVAITNSSSLGNGAVTNTITLGTGATLSASGSDTLVANQTITLSGPATISSTSASLTMAGTVTNGGNLLTTSGAGNLLFNGAIGGTGGITNNNSGTVFLNGNNTYTGLTTETTGILKISGNETSATGGLTISGGTLQLNSTQALGTGNLTITGGIISNLTGSPLTLANSMPVLIQGNVTLGVAGDGGNGGINFGNGGVQIGANQVNPTITLAGSGDTYTFTGTASDNNTAGTTQPIVNGTGNTLVFSGPYLLTATGNSGVNFGGSANVTLSGGAFNGPTGTGGVQYSGTGTFILGGASTFSGGITQSTAGGIFDMTGSSSSNSTVAVNAGTFNLSGSLNGNGQVDVASGATLTESSTGVMAIQGTIAVVTAGTSTLSGSNTYTGSTTINGATGTSGVGSLTLDFSQAATPLTATNIINSASMLDFNSALGVTSELIIKGGGSGATNSQSFNNVNLGPGSSVVNVNQNGATTENLNLGSSSTFLRSPGSALDFANLPTGGTITVNPYYSLNGVMMSGAAAFTTGGGANFATVNPTTGVVGTLASGVTGAGNYTINNNVDVTNNDTPASGVTVNTLRFNNAGTNALNLSGANTINAGGVLVTPTATGANSITGGSLTSGGGHELVFINDGGPLSISSNLLESSAGPTSMTFTGSGTTTISGTGDTYTGLTSVMGTSTLAIGSSLTLGGSNGGLGLIGGTGSTLALGTNTLTLNVAYNNQPNVSGTNTSNTSSEANFDGTITSSSGTIVKTGLGLQLLDTGASYAGGITVLNGTIQLGSSSGTGTITLGGTGDTNNASVITGPSISNPIVVAAGTGAYTFGIGDNKGASSPITLNNNNLTIMDYNAGGVETGAISGTGNIFLNTPNGSAGGGLSNASINMTGSITDVSASSTAVDTINGVLGSNVTNLTLDAASGFILDITGAELYNAGTFVDQGTLNLGNAGANGSLPSTSALTLGGGTLAYTRTGTVSQAFASTTINPGASAVTTSTATQTLTLNGITHNVGGTVNFSPFAGSTIATTTGNTASILGPWATYGSGTGIAYATVVSNAITSFIGTSASTFANVTGSGGTANFALQADTGTSAANASVNTISSTTGAGANSVINAGGLQANGLLNSGTGTWTISGGPLQIGANNELVVAGNSANTTISANIVNDGSTASALTYSGTGTLALQGTNSYSGATYINSGTLQITSAANLDGGSGGTIYMTGSTLDVNSGTFALGNTIAINAASTIQDDAGTVTLNGNLNTNPLSIANGQGAPTNLTVTGSGNTILNGVIGNGAGGLTKSGSGTLTLNGANTYYGNTTLSAGTVIVGNASAFGTVQPGNEAQVNISSGTLDLETNTSINAYNMTIGNVTVDVGRATTGGVTTQTIGNLNVGQTTAAYNAGSNMTGVTPTFAISGLVTQDDVNGGSTGFNASQINLVLNDVTGTATTGLSDIFTFAGSGAGNVAGAASPATVTVQGWIINGINGGQVVIAKSGTGTTIFQGNNSYTGATTITGGALNIQSNGGLGTGIGASTSSVTVSSGGALQLQNSITTAAPVPLSLAGSGIANSNGVTVTPNGALESVSGTNTYTGAITLASSASIGADAGSLTLSGVIGGGSSAVLTTLGGSSSLVTLTGTNTYTGGTVLKSGELNAGSAAALSSGSVTFTGGTLQYSSVTSDYSGVIVSSTGAISIDTNGYSPTLASALAASNSGGLTKLGSGTLTLGNSGNAYTGANTLTAGTLAVSAAGDLGAVSTTLAFNGGTLEATTGSSVTLGSGQTSLITAGDTANIQVDSGATLTLGDAINETTASGALNKTGIGTLVFAGSNGNTYTGTTTISAGIINYENGSSLGATSAIVVANGATAQIGDSVVSGGSKQITISGAGATGVGATGALEALDTLNDGATYSGPIVLGASATIASDQPGAPFILSGGITASGSGYTLTVTGPGGTTISGVIDSTVTGGLVVNGGGILTLTNANTFSGGTIVSNGATLVVGATNALLSTGSVVLGEAVGETTGALQLGTDATHGYNQTLASLTTAGSGAGNAVVGAGNSSHISTLTINNSTSDLYSGTIGSGSAGTGTANQLNLTKTGAGTLTLSGANTYVGATSVSAGALNLSGSLNASTATTASITTSSTGVFTQSGGTIAGTHLTFTQGSSGTSTLAGANTFAGAVAVQSGTLDFTTVGATAGAAQSLGEATGASAITLGVASTSSGTLQYTGTGAANLAKSVSAVGNGANTIQNSGGGLLTLSGTLTKTDTALVLNGGSNGIMVTGTITNAAGSNANFDSDLYATGIVTVDNSNNSYSGATHIYGNGTLSNGLTGALPSSTVVELGNSDAIASESGSSFTNTYNLNGYNQSVAGITSTNPTGYTDSNSIVGGTGNGATHASNLTVTPSGSDTYSGVIGGSGSNQNNINLTMSGSGTLTLSGANTYTGSTTISTGTLQITGSTASAGTVGVSNGATLSGTGSTGVVTVSGGGNVNLQDGAIDSLTVAGLTTGGSPASTLLFDLKTLSGSTTVDDINDTGNLTLNSSTTINIGSLTGTTTLINGTYTLIAVTGTTTINGTLSGDLTLTGTALGLASNQTLSLIEVGNNIDLKIASSVTPTTYTLTTSAGSTLLHVGQSTGLTTTLTNTGTGLADSIDYSGVGASTNLGSVGGSTISGNVANGNTAVSDTAQTFNGSTAGVATISSAGSLTNHTVGGTPTGTPTGTTVYVYSGQSTWAGTSSTGVWGTGVGDSNFGVNWGNYQTTGYQGSPGVTTGYTGQDTATFANVTPTAVQVNLAGATPNLNSITFSASTTSYIIGGGSDTGTITLSGSSPAINVTAGSPTIGAPIVLGANTSLAVASGTQLTISGQVSGASYGLSTPTTANGGGGTTILSNLAGNTYGGGTTIAAGKFYVTNTSNSGTGSGSVSVTGGTLAGTGTISGTVAVSGGASLYSGGVPTGTPVVSANTSTSTTGLILTNTSTSLVTPALSISSANLTFALGTDTTSSGQAYDFAHPSTNSTWMQANGLISFSGSDSISLVDLTNTSPVSAPNGTLTLRQSVPYLLISDSLGDAGYNGLVTVSGPSNDLVYSLDQNGFVVGVAGAGWVAADGTSDTTAIQINQFGADGVTALTPGPNGIYPGPVLYLYNGDLEVVPEPGTWALMLGGLALLLIVQRSRRRKDS